MDEGYWHCVPQRWLALCCGNGEQLRAWAEKAGWQGSKLATVGNARVGIDLRTGYRGKALLWDDKDDAHDQSVPQDELEAWVNDCLKETPFVALQVTPRPTGQAATEPTGE